jgi:hypothetical protein
MSRFRPFVLLQLPLLTISALLLSGALAEQTPSTGQPAPAAAPAPKPATPAPPPKPDANAIAALNKAIDGLDSKKLGAFETKLWQKVDTVGLSFQSNGVYLSGPKDRLRMEMQVRLGNVDSKLLVVSDGSWVWNEVKLGNDKPLIQKYDLKEVQKQLNAPGTMPTFVENFYRSQSFRGVLPLLQSLSKQMTFTKFENASWKGREVYKLTGVWSTGVSKDIAPPGQPWPLFSPRTCNLFLARDKDNPPYWPYRLEWWGPADPGQDDVLLMQIEFRDPHVFPANSELPKHFTESFAYSAGKADVADVTKDLVAQLQQAKNAPTAPRPSAAPEKP